MAREFNEKKFYTDFCERLGFISLQQECGLGDWRGAVARVELLDRLLAIRVDDLLCYDDPGWHSVSPMHAAIEYQGALPHDIRNSGGDRIPMAAERLRRESRASELARLLVDALPPKQRVAVLVDCLRKRHGMTRREACEPENWLWLVGKLQLRRWLEPSKLMPVKAGSLDVAVAQTKNLIMKCWSSNCSTNKTLGIVFS